MSNVERFDRFTILKGLYMLLTTFEQDIVHNSSYSKEHKADLIQKNNAAVEDVINRLLEKYNATI